ncbi:hypothetical protein D9M68_405990 [compost metagenome]
MAVAVPLVSLSLMVTQKDERAPSFRSSTCLPMLKPIQLGRKPILTRDWRRSNCSPSRSTSLLT